MSRSDNAASSRCPKLLRQHHDLAGAGDIGPAAVEFSDQRLQRIAAGAPLKRRQVGEFIRGLMQRGLADAPEPPGLLDAERFRGVGQMFLLVPLIECLAF